MTPSAINPFVTQKIEKKIKKNYKFAPPTILPAPPLALLFTQCIEMLKNLLVVLKNQNFYCIVFLLARICKKTIKKPKLHRVNEQKHGINPI